MSKTILYVDDEPYFVESLVDALRDEGYLVEQAMDGSEVIERLEKLKPDLIIIDIIMPMGEKIVDENGGMRTGLRDLETIRRKMELRIPIVFVTVVDDPAVHHYIRQFEEKYGMGSKSFILVKPVYPTELIDVVNNLIGEPS